MRWMLPAIWWLSVGALVAFREPLRRMLSTAWPTKVSAIGAVAVATEVSLKFLR